MLTRSMVCTFRASACVLAWPFGARVTKELFGGLEEAVRDGGKSAFADSIKCTRRGFAKGGRQIVFCGRF